MGEQKIKQAGGEIGRNIRRVRLERGMGQTELVRRLQLDGVPMTRETLVKIERGVRPNPRRLKVFCPAFLQKSGAKNFYLAGLLPAQTPRPWGE